VAGTIQADFLQPQSSAGLSILNPSGNTVMASVNSAGIFSSTGSLLVANTGNVFSTGNVTASGTVTAANVTASGVITGNTITSSNTIIATNISDGANTTSMTNAVLGSAKAWVTFTASGSTTVNKAYGVSSVTWNGTGQYTVNYTNAFADTNYVCLAMADGYSGSYGLICSVDNIYSSNTQFSTWKNYSSSGVNSRSDAGYYCGFVVHK